MIMTQEEEELLLKDLCVRLPYGVKVLYENEIFEVEHVCPMYGEIKLENEYCTIGVSGVKPYLFPLSSMTDEQKEEYKYITERWMYDSSYSIGDSIDWLNKNHFDYRGLIKKLLAVDCTNLNIY